MIMKLYGKQYQFRYAITILIAIVVCISLYAVEGDTMLKYVRYRYSDENSPSTITFGFITEDSIHNGGEVLNYDDSVLVGITDVSIDKTKGYFRMYDYEEQNYILRYFEIVDNKRDGIEMFFCPNGQTTLVLSYSKGRIENCLLSKNSKGMDVPFGTLCNGNGTLKYYPTGEGEDYTTWTYKDGLLIKTEY